MKRLPAPPKSKQPDYRRIAEEFRLQITGGKWAPLTQLPATPKLATAWKTSYFTIHKALQVLVKEGWIERVRGAGTYVAEPKTRFTCAAIYESIDLTSNEEAGYDRSVIRELKAELGRLGKEIRLFPDSRPVELQTTVLPELAEAILHRHVQCVICQPANGFSEKAISALPVPVVFPHSYANSPNSVGFELEYSIERGADLLRGYGCRSIGFIHNFRRSTDSCDPYSFTTSFRKAAFHAGLKVREEWIRCPDETPQVLQRFGYRQFHALWKLRRKPDGLLIYPDHVAMGAMMAILEIGMREVTSQMKFVFYRNAHMRFPCPFPVTWAISDEAQVARAMVETIQRQFAGEKVSTVLLPYQFTESPVISDE